MTGTFVHIGDAHMAPGPRNADRWQAIDQIIDANIDRTDLLGWLIPGDLNDARMSIDDRNAWALRLRRMADVAPVFVVYGNHDVAGDLDVFGKLAATWPIYVVARPHVLTVALPHGHVGTIFCLPYPTEAGLVAQGVAPGEVVQTARLALDAIFIDAAERLEAARKRGEITLTIGHVNVSGSITCTGQPNIGREIEIDQALINRLGSDYVGLNHIHKAQNIPGTFASYPGSICRLDWGEIDPKGYLVVEYQSSGNGWVLSNVWRRLIDVPPMYHVEGWLTRDGFDYECKAGPDGAVQEKPASWTGCEVRVRYKFHQSEKSLLEMAKAHIYAEFADAARLETEPVAVPDNALRAPAVAAAKTLAEKVGAWAEETKTVLPADVLSVLPALEHGDALVLIEQERAAAAALLGDPVEAAFSPPLTVDQARDLMSIEPLSESEVA